MSQCKPINSIRIFFFVLNLFFFTVNDLQAQKFNTLGQQEKEVFKEKAFRKIEELSNFFGKIALFPKNSVIRKELIKSCLKSFVKDATMQIGNLKKGLLIKSNPIPLNDYLTNRLKPSKYKIVDVTFVDFKIDDFKPLASEPNKYYADFEYTQRFCASLTEIQSTEGIIKYDYCDDTTKKGRFILEKKQTVLGSKWALFFDSVSVVGVKLL